MKNNKKGKLGIETMEDFNQRQTNHNMRFIYGWENTDPKKAHVVTVQPANSKAEYIWAYETKEQALKDWKAVYDGEMTPSEIQIRRMSVKELFS